MNRKPPPTIDSARPVGQQFSRRDLLRFGGMAAAGLGAAGLGTTGLTACAGSGPGAQDDSGLQFMYWGSTFEQTAVNKMLDQFERRSGIPVSPIYTPNDYDTKLNTLIASNEAPNVAYIGSSMAHRLAEQGKLVNLFPYLEKYPRLANGLPGTYLWYGKDKMLGTQTASEIMLLWYNKAVLDDAGVDYPPAVASEAWSWDDLVSNAYRLTLDREGRRPDESGFDPSQIKQFGISISIENPAAWYGFLLSRGVDFVDESGTRCLLDTPEAIEVLQNVQDLIFEHHVAPTPAQAGGADAPATNVQLQTRRIAMVNDGQWILLDMSQSDLDFGIGVLPRYAEPYTVQQGGASAVFAGKRVDDAVELFMFHNDPKHVDLYKEGLWMPLERKYYTDEAAIASWTDNDVHPPEYKTAVVDYALEHAVTLFGQRLKNMDNIDEVLIPALQEIQTGKRPARDVLVEVTPKINERLQGWHYTQEL